MNDHQLLRYSRHILLDEIGIEGQSNILAAKVLIVGAGGLGSPAALYLASSGVGSITLADADLVDLTNLQRQIMHNNSRIGTNKAQSGKQSMQALNPDVQIIALEERISGARFDELAAQADVVLDCSDNFATRHALNRACVNAKVPLVSGAAVRFDGQISVFDKRDPNNPCYACLFPPEQEFEEVQCAQMGVFAPLVGIIGAMQAAEALKLIIGCGENLIGKLQILDARTMQWNSFRYARNPACSVCG